jgi:hypothetical protein
MQGRGKYQEVATWRINCRQGDVVVNPTDSLIRLRMTTRSFAAGLWRELVQWGRDCITVAESAGPYLCTLKENTLQWGRE